MGGLEGGITGVARTGSTVRRAAEADGNKAKPGNVVRLASAVVRGRQAVGGSAFAAT